MKNNIEENYPNGKLKSTVPSKNGLRNGHMKIFYETGELWYEGVWKDDFQQGLWKLFFENGDIKRENTFKDGNKIYQKEYYLGNKIHFEGKFREDNENEIGKWVYYHENGKLQKEEVFKNGTSSITKEFDEDETLVLEHTVLKIETENKTTYGIRKLFFKNGDLKSQSELLKTGDEFFEHGHHKEYYENKQLKNKGEFEYGYKNGKWNSYFQNGKLSKEELFREDNCGGFQLTSKKVWNENGTLIEEYQLKDGDTRQIISHEVMTKGSFTFELNNETTMEVYGQRHTLVEIEEYYEDGKWFYGDREEVDCFHLTGYEEGYLFDEGDLCRLFDVKDCGEWDFNGSSTDWCGIEEEDNKETRQKKWGDYKSKFERIKSKDQFDVL